MHRAAEQVLNDVLQKYGSSCCDTPQMLETFLRKHGRGCSQEVEILIVALRRGIISDLRSDRPREQSSLARVLATGARIAPSEAEWAVATWAAALEKAPGCVASPPAAEDAVAPQGYSAARAVTVLTLAAATGVIAYLTFGQ